MILCTKRLLGFGRMFGRYGSSPIFTENGQKLDTHKTELCNTGKQPLLSHCEWGRLVGTQAEREGKREEGEVNLE
jgi:hypothetical protein